MVEVIDVPCGSANHRVELRIDQGGRIRCVLAHHDERAEAVLEALGGAASACSAVASAVGELRPQVGDSSELASWLRLGVRCAADLHSWRRWHVHSPQVAARWLAVADRSDIASWVREGFTRPEEVEPWAAEGFAPRDARAWREAVGRVGIARAWLRGGVSDNADAGAWGELGVRHPDGTDRWRRAGVVSGLDASWWAAVGIEDPADVRTWLRAGVSDGADAVGWAKLGERSGGAGLVGARRELARWHAAGVLSSRDAAAWQAGGADVPDLAEWRRAGVASGHALVVWRYLGVEEPADLAWWHANGVTDDTEAATWRKAGVRCPADFERWMALGILEARLAKSWVWPTFVTGFDEVAAWLAAGVRDADDARRRDGSGRVPATVQQARDAGRERLGARWSSAPDSVVTPPAGADPRAVRTERYAYAFWHRCRPDRATDVVEIDLDADGNEAGRRLLPVRPEDHHGVRSGRPVHRRGIVGRAPGSRPTLDRQRVNGGGGRR